MGLASHYNNTVTLVNRTKGGKEFERNLNVRYDGEDMTLKPGRNPGVPLEIVPFAVKQNPLMGTANPVNAAEFTHLVGVEANTVGVEATDCSPIPYEILKAADEALEIWDRNGSIHGEVMAKVKLFRQKKQYAVSESRAAGSVFETQAGNNS